jgi:uncharacterized protein
MLETIEKLLILQERDRNIRRVEGELAHIEPQRQMFRARVAEAQTGVENAKNHVKQLESSRKDLELEVDGKKQLIAKYALQQFQTRKNEEYRALAHEIDMCKAAIVEIEDRELELMEQAETAQKEAVKASQVFNEQRKIGDDQIAQLDAREQNLKKELAQLLANREELARAVDETARVRYERQVKSKGETVVVGVQHSVCGGCHMRLPAQVLVMCQAEKDLVACTNCGRILYYTPDMDLAAAE